MRIALVVGLAGVLSFGCRVNVHDRGERPEAAPTGKTQGQATRPADDAGAEDEPSTETDAGADADTTPADDAGADAAPPAKKVTGTGIACDVHEDCADYVPAIPSECTAIGGSCQPAGPVHTGNSCLAGYCVESVCSSGYPCVTVR